MTKKKILGLNSGDIPEGLANELENFIKNMVEDKEDTKLIPLLTISQKDLLKYARIQGRRDMVNVIADAFQTITEAIQEDGEKWWKYIEDKYDIDHNKKLHVNPETGLISERVKDDKGLKVVKKEPLN